MNEKVTLNNKEQKRLKVLNEVIAGHMTGQQAAAMLGLSLRHVRRLLAGYRQKGAPALAHGNRGRASPRQVPEVIRAQVITLAMTTYHDYNDQHFTEELGERHEIVLSRSTVRRIRRSAGLSSPRKRRAPKHRSRRPRYAQPGMLIQVDGSQHDWLEGRGPRLTLISAIDDATNEVPYALFREQEDAAGYFLLMQHIGQSHGLPLAVYADRHNIFQSPKKATIEEELAGKYPRSQFGRLLDELHIRLIPAYSPQAKGRIERLFNTFQDRLVKELRRAGATSIEEANQVLWNYLPRFNDRFQRAADKDVSAYRPWPETLDADRLFCFKYERVVTRDNVISFAGHQLQLPPGPAASTYAGHRVQIHQQMDNNLLVFYQNKHIAKFAPADSAPPRVAHFSPNPEQLWVKPPDPSPTSTKDDKPKQRPKPPKNHPWRRYGKSLRVQRKIE
jgi:transposase